MSSPAPLTENDINDINDLFAAFKLMQSLGVSPRGVTCLEDAKCRLLQYIKEKYGAGTQRHTNVSNNNIVKLIDTQVTYTCERTCIHI